MATVPQVELNEVPSIYPNISSLELLSNSTAIASQELGQPAAAEALRSPSMNPESDNTMTLDQDGPFTYNAAATDDTSADYMSADGTMAMDITPQGSICCV